MDADQQLDVAPGKGIIGGLRHEDARAQAERDQAAAQLDLLGGNAVRGGQLGCLDCRAHAVSEVLPLHPVVLEKLALDPSCKLLRGARRGLTQRMG
eukprot:8863799-Pyramimonas_sp.AAC.1